jgi:acetyl-CoA carboxylase biotin carboxyl carrier protein
MDLKQIQDLIEFVSQSGVSEVKLEKDDIKLTIKTQTEEEGEKGSPQTAVYPQMMPPQMMAGQAPMHQQQPAPAQQQPAEPAPQPSEKTGQPDQPSEGEVDESQYLRISSPMIGTFYRSPSPDKDPYVKVGDQVQAGQVVCVVEAMKLFNEIESEVSGKIVKIAVDNAAPVEYDQTLFLVDPNG